MSSNNEEQSGRKPFEEVRESVHNVWLAGLGVLATAEEEGSKVFARFVERGETVENRSREKMNEARERASEQFGRVTDRVGGTVEEQVAKTLKRLGVPTRSEIQALSAQIEKLTIRVEELTRASESKTA